MSVFRYFLPGVEPAAVNADVIRQRGLHDRLGDLFEYAANTGRVQTSKVRQGPGGLDGALVVPLPADGSPVQRSEFRPEQEWTRSSRGDYWIGRDPEHPSTPDGLRRTQIVGGYEHVLGDGQVWICPTIRHACVVPAVPCTYSRLNGELVREPLPEYREIFQRTAAWGGHYLGADGLPAEQQFDAAVTCLAVNYRIGDEEVSLLRLLNDRTLALVVEAAVDVPWLREAMSGSDPQKAAVWREICTDLESFAPGGAASSPGTSPPSPTSSCSDEGSETLQQTLPQT